MKNELYFSWYGTELRTILSGSKNLTHGKKLHVQFPSHLLKNIQGVHPRPKLLQNRNVLHGQIGLLMLKNLVLNHQTLVDLLKPVNKRAL